MARQSTITTFLTPSTSMHREGVARSASSESTLSCITLNNDVLPAIADEPLDAAMSSTPPTSLDTSSQISEHPKLDEPLGEQATEAKPTAPARSLRARNSVATYNENILVRNTRQAPRNADSPRRRELSGKTLVTGGKDATEEQNDLVRDSIQLLDLDWRVDALPGEKMDLDNGKLSSTKMGRRASLLKKATAAMDKGKGVLGKRAREMIEVGKNMGRRSSLRPRDLVKQSPVVETPEPEPAAKKRRVTDILPEVKKDAEVPAQASEMKSTPSTRQPKKIWLRQGLYVGQDQDFDARFNPVQNLKRKQKDVGKENIKPQGPPKRRTIMPLPMLAGKRTIETGRDFKLPFDVFNPLPPGQPKPDEWRKTQRNVFVGDAAEYWKINKNLEYSTCICTPETGCDEDCFNRMMFYECDKNNCNIGEGCSNRSFTQLRERVKLGNKYRVGVEVMKTANKGYGVRSCRTFAPGQIIVEYTGEIITQDECDQRMRTIYKDNECFYLMMFDQNMIIDATRGSIARFVNHSCEPNCRMVKWTVDGKPRMALFAGDNGIFTGEELTYDYNFDPFSAKNIQVCHCGADSCRGVLGPKPKDREPRDALKAIVEKSGAGAKAKQAKRKLKEVVEKGIEEAKSKKRRLSVDLGTVLKKSTKQDRAARATLRANIKGAKSKRVAAKLTEKLSGGKVKAKNSSRSLVSAKSGPSGKVLVTVSKKAGTATARGSKSKAAQAASIRSNVVRTMRGANGRAGGKSIKVVAEEEDVYDVPMDEN